MNEWDVTHVLSLGPTLSHHGGEGFQNIDDIDGDLQSLAGGMVWSLNYKGRKEQVPSSLH